MTYFVWPASLSFLRRAIPAMRASPGPHGLASARRTSSPVSGQPLRGTSDASTMGCMSACRKSSKISVALALSAKLSEKISLIPCKDVSGSSSGG